MSEKLSVWIVKHAEIVKPEKEAKKSTDPVITFNGTITKNGESQKQRSLKITKSMQAAGVNVNLSEFASKRIVTVSRIEKRAGRPQKVGMALPDAASVLASLGFNVEGAPEPVAAPAPAPESAEPAAK